MKLSTCSALVLMVLALSACGGGGGGGSNVTAGTNMPNTPGGTGGGGTGGGTIAASVCDGNEYCIRIENGLNAAENKAALDAAWNEIQVQLDALRRATQRGQQFSTADHPYFLLPPPLQQSLADLYHSREKALTQLADKSPPAPPQSPPATPETGSYTSQSGPVASWGVWRGDEPAPAGDQQRFSVNQLTDPGTDGFFANYQVTGTPTPAASLPGGTATWEGKYEGVYQLGDADGVWGARTEDRGTASIDVDFAASADAVTVTLTSDITDAKTFPGGSDTGGDVWAPAADLGDPKNTFNNNRVSSKPTEDEYSKIVGAVFGPNAEALAGVYEFYYLKNRGSTTIRVNDIRGAGWFGGCKDVTDFSCFQADAVTDSDPVPEDPPVPAPEPDPVTPGTFSHLGFGAWADRPSDFNDFDNPGDLTTALQVTNYYYLRGTRTSVADIGSALPDRDGTVVTWTGTYQGQYRTNPADDPQTDDEEHVWSVFADDSGTVHMELDLGGTTMEVTLTSMVGNTFPGGPAGAAMPKQSFAFDPTVNFSGNDVGGFGGDHHDDDERGNAIGSIVGAFFGPEAAEAGGVYSITQGGSLNQLETGIQVEAVGVFGATKQQ